MSSKSKIGVVAGISLLFALLGLLAYRHSRRPLTPPPQSTQQTTNPVLPENAGGQTSFGRPSHAMAVAFDTGALPRPLPAPSGDLDQAAATLAKQVAARDENSTSALMTALQMAGLSIRGKDGNMLLQPATRGQGMALDEWEVAAIAKLYGRGTEMSLADLGVVLSRIIPGIEKPSTAKLLTEAITHASGGAQPLRFWARFIAELGHYSEEPYDLLSGQVGPEAIKLDAIQLSLILLRMTGELSALDRAPTLPKKPAARLHRQPGIPAPVLADAVFHPRSRVRLLPVAETTPGSGPPCQLNEFQSTVLDATALADDFLLTSLVERIKENWSGLEHYGRASKKANLVLIIAKLIWTYCALNVEVTMDNPPLIRSEDTDPGQSRVLKANVTFNINTWQILNCLRPILNIVKVDLGNVPNHGAASGAGVEWNLLEGGTNHKQGGFHYVHSYDTANYLAIDQLAFVFFDNGPGFQGETWSTVADEDGVATMKVTGRPQASDLTPHKKFPWLRTMGVFVNIKVKVADKGSKLFAEFLDVLRPALALAGTAEGGEDSDPLTGLVDAIAETLYRMHWYASDTFTFPVRDWKVADGSWHGEIHLSDSHSENPPESGVDNPNFFGHTKGSSKYALDVTISVNGGGDKSGLNQEGTGHAKLERTRVTDSYSEERRLTCDGTNFHAARATSHNESREEADDSGPVTIDVTIKDSTSTAGALDNLLAQGDTPPEVRETIKQQMQAATAEPTYTIAVKGKNVPGTWSTFETETKQGYCDAQTNGTKTWKDGGLRENLTGYSLSVEGKFDPKNPEVLQGSTDKGSVHITWNLSR